MTHSETLSPVSKGRPMRKSKHGAPFSKRDEGRARRDARKAAARRKRAYLSS